MSTGFIAPPATLTVDGGAPVSLPVDLKSGNGVALTLANKGVTFGSGLADLPEVMSLFRPGLVAAVTPVGLWSNTYRSNNVFLRKLELNLLTAQTTGDPANAFRVKVTDTLGVTSFITMSAANAKHYLLDQTQDQQLAWAFGAPTAASGGAVSLASGVALSFGFNVTSNLTLTGLKTENDVICITQFDGTQNNTMPVLVRFGILDATGKFIAYGYSQTPNVPNSQTFSGLHVAFQNPVTLVPGTQYYLAIDMIEHCPARSGAAHMAYMTIRQPASLAGRRQNTNPMKYFTAAGAGSPAYGGATGKSIDPGNPDNNSVAQVSALTWPAILFGAPSITGLAASTGGASDFTWSLLGAPAGLVAMTGDLTFAIDTVGAPAGTAAGSDINIRALLAPS